VRALSGEELWCVLEAGVESWVAAGATPDGPWPKRLKRSPVEAGDRFLMPPGLVRCQGPNLTVLKILPTGSMVQTLFDWDRPNDPWDYTAPPKPVEIADGGIRQLKPVCEGRNRVLHRSPLYDVTLVNTSFSTAKGDRLSIICPIKGRARVQSTGGAQENLRLHPGQAVVIPAGLHRWSVESGTLVSYLHISLA
jgi:mannose-6-phosphate isomerase class I